MAALVLSTSAAMWIPRGCHVAATWTHIWYASGGCPMTAYHMAAVLMVNDCMYEVQYEVAVVAVQWQPATWRRCRHDMYEVALAAVSWLDLRHLEGVLIANHWMPMIG
ncbi:hypothetical protein Tco_1109576 [Tanacetum coccineum]